MPEGRGTGRRIRMGGIDEVARLQHRHRDLAILRSLGEIDLDNMSREVSDTGGEAVWWGTLAAEAQGDADRAKLRVEILRAEIGREYRQRQETLTQKVTERAVEETVTLDPRYQQAMEEQIAAAERAAVLRSAMFSVQRKQQTVESMSSMVLAERAGTPRSAETLRESMQRQRMAVAPPPREPFRG